jgi:hypothetical protein
LKLFRINTSSGAGIIELLGVAGNVVFPSLQGMTDKMAYDLKLFQRALESVTVKGPIPTIQPRTHLPCFGSNLVANCAEYYGSAGSSGY